MENGFAQAGTGTLSGVQGYGDAHALSDALDGVMSAARRTWRKARTNVTVQPVEAVDSDRLRDAFRVFTDAADRLEGT